MNTTTTLVHDTITKTFSSGLKGYQPLDRYDALHGDDPHEMGYRSARAKKRQVFLKSYRLASRTRLRRRSRSLKLKKVVAKLCRCSLFRLDSLFGQASCLSPTWREHNNDPSCFERKKRVRFRTSRSSYGQQGNRKDPFACNGKRTCFCDA